MLENQNNKLKYMRLTQHQFIDVTDKFEYSNGFEGLVLTETSQIHRSTYYFVI